MVRFSLVRFLKNYPNIQLKQFSVHAFLVTNDLTAADLVHEDFLQDLKKRISQGQGVHGLYADFS